MDVDHNQNQELDQKEQIEPKVPINQFDQYKARAREILNDYYAKILFMFKKRRRRRRSRGNGILGQMNHWTRRVGKSRRLSRVQAGMTQARVIQLIAVSSFLAVIVGGISVIGIFAWYSRDLPNPNQVVRREGFSTKIYDRNGALLYDLFGDENRVPIDIDQIPEHLKQATIAIEDKDFYQHEGFDLFGMARGFSRLFTRGRAQGGSTLTQQLVKNALLTSERRLSRKIKEFVLAVQIERNFTKDEILQMYLNEVPYGGTSWGVGTAAETYFNKSLDQLNLVEAAILAGMPQRPSYYSPFGSNPDAYVARTTNVLRRMREDGYITPDEEASAVAALTDVQFASASGQINAPHFVFYVIEELEELYGEDYVQTAGLRVTTTLDLDIHQTAQEIVTNEIADLANLNVGNGAALVMNPQTGEILSMVGSKDYNAQDYDGQVNVTTALRQPGSTIKPVTYAAGFIQGYTPATMLMDVATEFPGGQGNPPYEPVNYDGQFRGPVHLRESLGSSLNIPAVKLLALVGVENMLELAYDMGLTTLEPTPENLSRFGLAVTLGGGEVRLTELVSAYSSFANGGYRVSPVSILKIEDRNGNTVFSHQPIQGRRVFDEGVAFLINDILSDNNARLLSFGANSLLNMGNRDIAVKTGTTNDRRDNWTIGWSTNAIVGVWVGNNDNSPMANVASGVTGASPIWREIMLEMWQRVGGEAFPRPNNVEDVMVDEVSGYPEHDGFPARQEYVIRGTLPSLPDPIHTLLKLCHNQDRLATPAQIANNNFREKEYFVIKEDDPFNQEENKWQEGINAWLVQQGDERYRPPTEYCEGAQVEEVQIQSPTNETNYGGDSVDIAIRVFANTSVEELDILIDGAVRETLTQPPYNTTITLEPGAYELVGRAKLSDGKEVRSGTLKFGMGGISWEGKDLTEPSPSPSPSPTPDNDEEATDSGGPNLDLDLDD